MIKYSVGDRLVYGLTGVVEVVDVRIENIAGVDKEYYVLGEIGKKSSSYTFVPTDNEMLLSQMRPLMTREEAMELIRCAPTLPELEWVRDNRVRTEKFKRVMESGDSKSIISLIKTIYKTGERRVAEGKRNYLADEHTMHKAEKLLYSELSVVLDVPVDAIPEFIASNAK